MTVNTVRKKHQATLVVDDKLEVFEGKVLFPKKLEKANKVLKTMGLPKVKELI